MYKAESDLENATREIVWNFKIQTDHQIPARRPDSVDYQEKKKLVCKWILLFQLAIDWKYEKKGKYLDLFKDLKSVKL